MKLLHLHTSFREDFKNQRKAKKLALAIVIDAVGFHLGKEKLELDLLENYNVWLKGTSKKRLHSRLNKLKETCDQATDTLKVSNTWLDILELPVNFIVNIDSDFLSKYKMELTPLKDIDRLIRPYHSILDKVDDIQFI